MASVYDPDRQDGRGGFTLYMGIESTYLDLKPWAKFGSGGWFSSGTADEVIMGYEAAEVEQRSVGDKVFVPGKNKILTVVGIFERSGTQDDGLLFLPIEKAQEIFDQPGQLTGIGIKLKEMGDITEFEEDLYNEPGIQIISLAQVRGTILNLVSSAKVMTNSVAIIAVFIAVIGVTNTILMSVFERTREIGVMKAIGASSADIFRIIWAETSFICVIGGIFGDIIAIAAGNIVEHIFKSLLPYAPSGDIVYISPALLIGSLIGAIIMGMIAGIYPAFRAASMRPVEAIRLGE